MTRYVLPAEALSLVRSGMRVFIQTAAAAPQRLISAMVERASELRGVEIVHMHTEGSAAYVEPQYRDSFHASALFVGHNLREAVNSGRADYIPVFLSEVPRLFRRGILPLDVALVHVSPPDRHGFCSLGISVDVARAVQMARIVIAQINPNMPRTHGDGLIHISHIDSAWWCADPLIEMCAQDARGRLPSARSVAMSPDWSKMAPRCRWASARFRTQCCRTRSHRDLGIHTEMFSDGAIDLIERGVVNNESKRIHPGKVVSAGFAIGSGDSTTSSTTTRRWSRCSMSPMSTTPL
jgi:4-hydroxybutyrate CoA-transferase